MKVIKFGGTSVGDAHAIEQICSIIRDKKKQEDRYAIIVSAIGGITDKLVKCANFAAKKNEKYHLILDEIEIKHLDIIRELFTIINQKSFIISIIQYLKILNSFYKSIFQITSFSKRSLDQIMNFGELISSYLINEKLKESGFHSTWKDSRELIVTENQYGSAQVNLANSFLNFKFFFIKENTPYIILPGFIASSTEKETTTLGRGGSDYSASILSAAIQAELLEIWTDVSGIMTANPKIVSKAFPMENISYIEAIELSHFGAKVIYPPTLLPSIKNNIPIMIKNTFSPLERGTLISAKGKGKGLGISGMQILAFERRLGGFYKLFAASRDNFHVLLKQSSSEHSSLNTKPISVEKELCLIAVKKNISVPSMFNALGKESINLRVIVSTEKNISAVIAKKFFKKSMNTLHSLFFERPSKKIHIFIAGLGKVGSKLIEKLNMQKEYLVKELQLKIIVIGICNSKRMYFDYQGIDLNNWQENIKLGTNMNIEEFIGNISNLNLRNSIFVDTTASKEIANIYFIFLAKGIGVVTCNKIACASSYKEYKHIKNIASYFKAPLFFETNVGASLPIVNTLNSLVHSGDKIKIIYAVLSGSLNFIFNKFKVNFTEVVREAKDIGYTEPDPRIDLSGIDVMRKILILIRECGESIELEEIKQISLLPKSCIKAYTGDLFYQELLANEEHFIQIRMVAKEQRKRIHFMSKYKDGKISVGIEYIEFENPFYKLEGKDNMIIYTTEQYYEHPIIIKGAGAGSKVTASGVFSDIIKAYES